MSRDVIHLLLARNVILTVVPNVVIGKCYQEMLQLSTGKFIVSNFHKFSYICVYTVNTIQNSSYKLENSNMLPTIDSRFASITTLCVGSEP